MQVSELHVIMLHIAERATPQRVCCTGKGGGIPILRETPNCWYVESPSHGLPERFRKAEEYKLPGNRFGVYMFAGDSKTLAKMWNESTSVKT